MIKCFDEKKYIVIDNFLDNDIYEEIYNLVNNYNNFTKSKTHWPKTLYKQDEIEVGNVSVSDDTFLYGEHDELCIQILQNKIVEFLFEKFNMNYYPTFFSKIHNWKQSCILWHDDGNKYVGITYYLNKKWSKNWGGELLLEDNTFIRPKGNRIVFIFTPFQHKTNPTIDGADDRLTIQTFVGRKKQ